MTMQSLLNSMGNIKLAAEDGGSPHKMLPGRTTETVRVAGMPTMLVIPEELKKKKKKKKPIVVPVVGVTPKMDINVRIKLGSDNKPTPFEILRKLGEIGHQSNTGAFPPVSSSVAQSITGGLDNNMAPEEGDLLKTPMVQGGSDGISQDDIIGNIAKVSAYRHEYAPGESGMLAIQENSPQAQAFNILSADYAEKAPPPRPFKDDLQGEAIGAVGGGAVGIGAGLLARKLMPFRGPLSLLPVLGGAALGSVVGAGAGRGLERRHIAATNKEEQDQYREGLLQHLREMTQ